MRHTANPLKYKHRPKLDGLWVEIVLVGGTVLNGVLHNNLLECEPWKEIRVKIGYNDISIPRPWISELRVLGSMGTRKLCRS